MEKGEDYLLKDEESRKKDFPARGGESRNRNAQRYLQSKTKQKRNLTDKGKAGKKSGVKKRPVMTEKPRPVKRKPKPMKLWVKIALPEVKKKIEPPVKLKREPIKPLAKSLLPKVEPRVESPKVVKPETEKKHPDFWSNCGQIFFTAGKAYGVTDHLRTICVGTTSAVQDFIRVGRLEEDLNDYQKSVLIKVKETQGADLPQIKKEKDEKQKSPTGRKRSLRVWR